jgi:membrane protease YdiL (CAAX protease family)
VEEPSCHVSVTTRIKGPVPEMKLLWDNFRIFNTLAFVVFSIALGHVASAWLSGLILNLSTAQIWMVINNPVNADRTLLVLLSAFYSLFGFLIIPFLYLSLVKREDSVKFLIPEKKIRFTPSLLSVILVFALLPVTALLIKINQEITFPIWLSELESYFRKGEEDAARLTSVLLSFRNVDDVFIAIVVMAIIPGIVEELFFRGIIQSQLQVILKNVHYAIWFAAFLFSFFHFQFYGLVPRLMLGSLLGYIFLWTKNIWYACLAHVVNNLLSILGAYYLGTHFFSSDIGGGVSLLLLIPSTIVTGFVISYLKKVERAKPLST